MNDDGKGVNLTKFMSKLDARRNTVDTPPPSCFCLKVKKCIRIDKNKRSFQNQQEKIMKIFKFYKNVQ